MLPLWARALQVIINAFCILGLLWLLDYFNLFIPFICLCVFWIILLQLRIIREIEDLRFNQSKVKDFDFKDSLENLAKLLEKKNG